MEIENHMNRYIVSYIEWDEDDECYADSKQFASENFADAVEYYTLKCQLYNNVVFADIHTGTIIKQYRSYNAGEIVIS